MPQLAVAWPDSLNVSWPAPHHSWSASDSNQGTATGQPNAFCRGVDIPDGLERVNFPVLGGRLQFVTRGYERLDLHTSNGEWAVQVAFDDIKGPWAANQTFMAPAESGWKWNGGKDGRCSSPFRAIDSVIPTGNDPAPTYNIPPDSLDGVSAVLAVQMTGTHRDSRTGSNAATIIRQCTFIRFMAPNKIQDVGPCGIQSPDDVSASAAGEDPFQKPMATTLLTIGLVVGVTLLVVIGVKCWRRWGTAYRGGRAPEESTVYDARAARLSRDANFVPAPDYETANSQAPLPTYEQAIKQKHRAAAKRPTVSTK
ncbi:hypothetical protein AAL_00981 [Moelleriella libera RCEF 2490]|uniref:Uncharacterized protein n=1 Tax=Moelleriella libera RCEF 2490 TaxID=1081109 RepID=A0A166VCL3_9HYPO|nr:hypothetical protein AAL_00981 [Moelleriella libera RCEF 2490]